MLGNQAQPDWCNALEPPPLNEQERALLDAFVLEYVKDYDEVRACIRLGFQVTYATEYGKTLLYKSYVQQKLQTMRDAFVISNENEVKYDESLIIQTLREAAQKGDYKSRVSAAAKLATIRGLDKQQQIDSSENLIEAFRMFAQKAPV